MYIHDRLLEFQLEFGSETYLRMNHHLGFDLEESQYV